MRIFAGFDRRQSEAVEVFAYSVREHASIPVDIVFLRLEELPLDRKGTTDFTFSRFLCPYICAYQGRAVFADAADMLCLGDIAELADWDMQGKPVCVVKHTAPKRPLAWWSWSSFMLMDCTRLQFLTPAWVQEAPTEHLMRLGGLPANQIGELPETWNKLLEPGEEPPEGTKIAHYTSISDPDIGPWIDASRSKTWAGVRERWRRAQLEDAVA
jgi:hypothetical protein